MNADDAFAIQSLLARVARLTDQWSETDELTQHYTQDCVWHLEGSDPYRGHEGITRRTEEMRAAGVCGPGLAMRHIVSIPEITPDPNDPNRAEVISFVAMANMSEGKPVMSGYGQYTDEVRKVAGRWLLRRRYGVAFW